MKKSSVIEINGRRYNAHDGRQLDSPKSNHAEHSAATEKNKPSRVSRQKADFVKRRPQNHSTLLMRQAVRPPAAYVRVTYRANGTLQPEITIESNLPIERIARRANHASAAHKSHSIKHFDRYAFSHYVNNDVAQPEAPNTPINDFTLNPMQTPKPLRQPRTSAEILELAIMNVNLLEPAELPQKKPFYKLRRRTKHFAR